MIATQSRSDEELMNSYLAGNVEAFDELYRRYKRIIESFHGIHWRSLKADLMQETFLRVLRGSATFNPQKAFKPWLFKIAVNVGHEYSRKHLAQNVLNTVDDMLSNVVDPCPNSHVQIDQRMHVRQLLKTLAALDQRILFLYSHGLTDQEISEVLNSGRSKYRSPLTPKNISTRRGRALKRLAEQGVRAC